MEAHSQLREHQGYKAVQAIHGLGATLAAVIVAAVGGVIRCPSPKPL